MDLINRVNPDEPEVGKEAIDDHRETVMAYFSERFAVENDGKPCPHGDPVRFQLNPGIDRVILSLRFDCPNALRVVTLTSTLWHDEETPHDTIGTFQHEQASEKYFFSRGERVARIDLATLLASEQSPPAPSAAPVPSAVPDPVRDSPPDDAARPVGLADWIWQGVVHIFGGLDHVLFVICLVIATATWKQLALVVTGFTVAHSMTLALGGLGLVTVHPRLVEPLIAASIIYVAAENAFRDEPRARFGVTFGFGLIHGFGFSSVLLALGLPSSGLVPALLGFNLGVELGQLAIVAPVFPLVLWLRKSEKRYRQARLATSAGVGAIAAIWLVERVLDVSIL